MTKTATKSPTKDKRAKDGCGHGRGKRKKEEVV